MNNIQEHRNFVQSKQLEKLDREMEKVKEKYQKQKARVLAL